MDPCISPAPLPTSTTHFLDADCDCPGTHLKCVMKSIRSTSWFLRRAQKKPTPKQKKHRKACPSPAQQSHSDRLRCSEDVCSSAFRAVLAPEQSLGGIQTLLKNKFKVKLVGKEEKHSTGSWLPFLPSHPQITQNTEVSFDLPTASLFPSLKLSLIS